MASPGDAILALKGKRTTGQSIRTQNGNQMNKNNGDFTFVITPKKVAKYILKKSPDIHVHI
jgi:hypothetical protein